MSLVLTSQSNQTLTITINRPDKKNALTREMYQLMADALLSIKNDGVTKAVVIKGSGDCFTAGNDINDFAAQKDVLCPLLLKCMG